MKKIDSKTFKEHVTDEKGLVLVDFSATWCGPCQMLHPVLEGLIEKENLKIYSVDVDESSDLASEYGISAVPSVLVFVDGSLKDTFMGFQSEEAILEKIKGYR